MADPRSPRFLPGELLADRYRLQGAVDRAGFGPAWKARDESAGRAVEVHDLGTPRGIVGLGEAVALLTRYAAAKHRALATTHEAFVHAGGVVVVVAPGEGTSLEAWFEERCRGGMGARLEATRTILDQVAQGLWALHRAGDPPLAHGAFGGPCVRVESRGTQAVVRVESHGWARVVAPPAWWGCPPEGEAQTPAADVFALGLLAAKLLTGPSSATTPDAVRHRFEVNTPEVDASVVAVIAACLTADPTLRIPDARALRERFVHPSVSWKPRERPVVVPAPPPRRAVAEEEAPVIAVAPLRGPQVWLVPAKAPAAPAPLPPAEAEEQTQVEPPKPPRPRPVAAKRPPAVEEDEETAVDASSPIGEEEEEEATQVEPPSPPPCARIDGDERDEVTDVAEGDAFRAPEVAAEDPRPPVATRRIDLVDATRVLPVPVDEATHVPTSEGAEATSPIGVRPGAFASHGEARERTLVPGRSPLESRAFVPEENTAPMDDAAHTARGPTVTASSSLPEAPSANPTSAGLPLLLLVAAVITTGVLLGLVLWWAIR